MDQNLSSRGYTCHREDAGPSHPSGATGRHRHGHERACREQRTVVTLNNVGEALTALGVSNYQFAKRCFAGGARQIVAYVLKDAETLVAGLAQLDPYYFDVATIGREVTSDEVDDLKTWRIANELDGKNFVVVAGGAAGLADNTAIKNLYATGKHGDIMYVGMGGVDIDGNVVSPGELAAWIAGKQGGRGMTQGSLTRQSIDFLADVERRLTKAQREELYTAGIAVPIHNGNQVVLEAAITSSKVIEGTNPSKPHHSAGSSGLRTTQRSIRRRSTMQSRVVSSARSTTTYRSGHPDGGAQQLQRCPHRRRRPRTGDTDILASGLCIRR